MDRNDTRDSSGIIDNIKNTNNKEFSDNINNSWRHRSNKNYEKTPILKWQEYTSQIYI